MCDFEHNFHVIRRATPSEPPMQIMLCGGGDEEIVVTRFEFQSTGCGRKRAKCDGHIHDVMRFVAHRNDPRVGIANVTILVFLTTHHVDDIPFHTQMRGAKWVGGTDNIGLIVLKRMISHVDIEHIVVVIDPEHGIGGVPKDVNQTWVSIDTKTKTRNGQE